MNRPFRLLTLLAVAAAAVLAQVGTAEADDWVCPFPVLNDVYAYQDTPEATMLVGRVDPGAGCPTSGIISRVDGSEQYTVDSGYFQLPLDARSGEWYLSSFTVEDETRTFEPVAPYLVKVLDLTRMTSSTSAVTVGYGEQIEVSGVLEGWTPATGWQPIAGRELSIATGNGVDGHLSVPTTTDESGAYHLSVRIFASYAGSAHFAGDARWLGTYAPAFTMVHGLVSVHVSDRTPGVGQRIRITGRVAPGSVPVWLEQRIGTAWVRVTPVVTSGADGHYRLTYRPTTRGPQQYRIWNDGTDQENYAAVRPYYKEFKLAVHR
jgi:hypothetical protein